jgi:hypothetical protein
MRSHDQKELQTFKQRTMFARTVFSPVVLLFSCCPYFLTLCVVGRFVRLWLPTRRLRPSTCTETPCRFALPLLFAGLSFPLPLGLNTLSTPSQHGTCEWTATVDGHDPSPALLAPAAWPCCRRRWLIRRALLLLLVGLSAVGVLCVDCQLEEEPQETRTRVRRTRSRRSVAMPCVSVQQPAWLSSVTSAVLPAAAAFSPPAAQHPAASNSGQRLLSGCSGSNRMRRMQSSGAHRR